MIYAIGATERFLHNDILDQMFQLRARVFKDRLNWDVAVTNRREFDRFDECDVLYLASVNELTGKLQGSLRLLPTTGPNMLRDVFPALLSGGDVVENSLIWESSRFCIDPDLAAQPGRLNSVTTELFCGVVEVGLSAGLETVVSVYDARMVRIFRRANWPAEPIGLPVKFGEVLTHAGCFEVSTDARHRLGLAGGHPYPVVIGLRATAPAPVIPAALSSISA